MLNKFLVIGGAGFIGTNIADYLLQNNAEVIIFDNLSRKGTIENLKWLEEKHKGKKLEMVVGDIRVDKSKLLELIQKVDAVYHLAAQVAVTCSVNNPYEDFMINAVGTFNVLEAVRHAKSNPILIFASTNKVYGGMEDIEIADKGDRHEYKNLPLGIPENRLLDFHSPYGCSKGAADQYVHDYSRIYGLRTVVFRQSCIYGKRQFGIEDQGWVAWFTIAAALGCPITIYGDGKQIRDVLYVEDLIQAFVMATKMIDKTAGKIYNIGGGPENTMSLLELISYLKKMLDQDIQYSFAPWRPGDQPVYVSDIRKAKKEFGWEPQISVNQGVKRLADWVSRNQELFRKLKLV
ncbi:MAG: GDP-mannose 4,6-dehydratase [Patescibacteria group bacterium]|nr:GDP-mannose 4,6-dehydratase [Patescibacteria group bacterium]